MGKSEDVRDVHLYVERMKFYTETFAHFLRKGELVEGALKEAKTALDAFDELFKAEQTV